MDVEAGTTDDAGAVTDMWVSLAAEQDQHGAHVLPEENRETIREEMTRHAVAERLLVARDDGLVGFVTVSLDRGRYDMAVRQGVVENLYVVPSRRDEGIGTALLAAAERLLAERGADTVALEALADNLDARRFYRRQGYEDHRVRLEKPLESDNHSRQGE